jgi:hypothetical protein
MSAPQANKKNREAGIALVLSVIVLAALIGLVIVVADLTTRATSDSNAIKATEIALAAAETAVELTIYDIEKNDKNLTDFDPPITQSLADGPPGAFWYREVKVSTSTPALCSSGQPVCTDNDDIISASNPLSVTLQPGQSFQLDLDIGGAEYPNRVTVSWGGTNTRVIVLTPSGHETYTGQPVQIPDPPANLDPVDNYRFRIINESSSVRTYTIRPNAGTGADELPLGFKIIGIGTYQNVERRLEILRPAWVIY